MSNEYSQLAEVGIDITFNSLVSQIQTVHTELAAHAGRAVNISLTIRNWLIGYYIAEYEQNGADRAECKSSELMRFLFDRDGNRESFGFVVRYC